MTKKTKTHGCSIEGCTKVWHRGGRAGRDGAPVLCPMHYHRARRDSAAANDPRQVHGRAATVRVHLTLPIETAQLLEKCAAEFDASQGAIIGKALDSWLATLQSGGRKGSRS